MSDQEIAKRIARIEDVPTIVEKILAKNGSLTNEQIIKPQRKCVHTIDGKEVIHLHINPVSTELILELARASERERIRAVLEKLKAPEAEYMMLKHRHKNKIIDEALKAIGGIQGN